MVHFPQLGHKKVNNEVHGGRRNDDNAIRSSVRSRTTQLSISWWVAASPVASLFTANNRVSHWSLLTLLFSTNCHSELGAAVQSGWKWTPPSEQPSMAGTRPLFGPEPAWVMPSLSQRGSRVAGCSGGCLCYSPRVRQKSNLTLIVACCYFFCGLGLSPLIINAIKRRNRKMIGSFCLHSAAEGTTKKRKLIDKQCCVLGFWH